MTKETEVAVWMIKQQDNCKIVITVILYVNTHFNITTQLLKINTGYYNWNQQNGHNKILENDVTCDPKLRKIDHTTIIRTKFKSPKIWWTNNKNIRQDGRITKKLLKEKNFIHTVHTVTHQTWIFNFFAKHNRIIENLTP